MLHRKYLNNISVSNKELLFIMTSYFKSYNYVCWFICLFGFHSISTFVGYLMSNPFLCK